MNASQYGISEIHPPGAEKLTWSSLLARTYSLYGRNFWPYFRIALVPALVAYGFQYLTRLLALRLMPRGAFPVLTPQLIALPLVWGWFRGAGFWIISTFFFAALAASFADEPGKDAPVVKDAYTLPRQRMGAVLGVALLSWTLFWLGRTLA